MASVCAVSALGLRTANTMSWRSESNGFGMHRYIHDSLLPA
jgi:hypothetical protein